MYTNILVATDFSNEKATIQSLKKTEKLIGGVRIVLLHVIEGAPYIVSTTRKTMTTWLDNSG